MNGHDHSAPEGVCLICEYSKRIAELEVALAGFTEEAPINWDAASIPQSVPFDPENPVHRNQAVGNMSVGYARIYAARKLLNKAEAPGVKGE